MEFSLRSRLLMTTSLLSVSMNLWILAISCKWKNMACDLWWLASFLFLVVKSYSYGIVYWSFVPFDSWVVFHCNHMSHIYTSTHLLMDIYGFCLFLHFGNNLHCYWRHWYVSICWVPLFNIFWNIEIWISSAWNFSVLWRSHIYLSEYIFLFPFSLLLLYSVCSTGFLCSLG